MAKKLLNPLFIFHVLFVGLVLGGILPRSLVLYETALLAIFFALWPIRESLIFFVRSIPIFIAIPLTSNFDNFNQWRLLVLLIFIKWCLEKNVWHYIGSGLIILIKKPVIFFREHSWLSVMILLLAASAFSILKAADQTAALKRIIYFVNAGLIVLPIIYPPQPLDFIKRLIRNITIPAIIVIGIGVVQVVSTYFIDIYQFMRLWGEGVQLRAFGTTWSYIAVNLGNTWFAYFGDQLSLRVFSLFPDSHSFPIFLLLALPAFMSWTLINPMKRSDKLKEMLNTRGKLAVIFIPLLLLMMILSGTRGIWAAGAAVIGIWTFFLRGFVPKGSKDNIVRYLSIFLSMFFVIFLVAYPIFSSPQFLVSKGDNYLFQKRFKSIVDFGETSNAQRLEIWRKTLSSIKNQPILGVGIGNYPVVLNQDIRLAKAGSSAHNIYLHVAAEIGLIGFALFIIFILLILRTVHRVFVRQKEPYFLAFFGGLLFSVPWILAYLMTDVAIFDERTLLLTAVTLAIIAN